MTQEVKYAEEAICDAERKARGYNGAKHDMYYEMNVEEKDVTSSMVSPSFIVPKSCSFLGAAGNANLWFSATY